MPADKPQSGAARIAALRARRAALGLVEVRGVWARPAHHARIKRYAQRLERPEPQDEDAVPQSARSRAPEA